ncbi:MAG: hypothetical protein ACKOD2_01430 [Ilumatobacteraceae bacterium]
MLDNGQVPSGESGSSCLDGFSDVVIHVVMDSVMDGVANIGPTASEESIVRGDPPPVGPWKRRSFWVMVLESARRETSWVRANRFYTAATAAQLASDIRSAHNRDPEKLRVRGVLPGERWEARWGVSPECPPGNFVIWVRYLGPS